MIKLFLPQTTLEEWALADKADIQGDKLVVPAENASYRVAPAVHFLKLVSGADARKLLSKVTTQSQLEQLGGEHMADSVILGEDAYEVATGYIAEVPSPADSAAKGEDKKKGSPEADLLAAFILGKTS